MSPDHDLQVPVFLNRPPEKDGKPLEGTALCLSGGGYRAMLFHMGTFWRLYEIGLLAKLDRISSVSGGSIIAAYRDSDGTNSRSKHQTWNASRKLLSRQFVPGKRLAAAALFYLAILGIVVGLAKKSNLLKEEIDPGKYLFSMGRTQMAFWFFVVLGAYLFIGVVTGTWIGTIGAQALALMGISATTGIAAAVVGKEKRQQKNTAPIQVDKLEELQETLRTAIAKPANVNNVPVLVEQLKSVGSQIAQLAANQATSSATSLSTGFWHDIASDSEGIALHRFQIIVWTVVLGFVFLMRVLTDLVMPELDPTTLTLMGISSGTYLGFKVP